MKDPHPRPVPKGRYRRKPKGPIERLRQWWESRVHATSTGKVYVEPGHYREEIAALTAALREERARREPTAPKAVEPRRPRYDKVFLEGVASLK